MIIAKKVYMCDELNWQSGQRKRIRTCPLHQVPVLCLQGHTKPSRALRYGLLHSSLSNLLYNSLNKFVLSQIYTVPDTILKFCPCAYHVRSVIRNFAAAVEFDWVLLNLYRVGWRWLYSLYIFCSWFLVCHYVYPLTKGSPATRHKTRRWILSD